MSLDELRRVLVEEWEIVAPDWWADLVDEFTDPAQIVDHLASRTRFRLALGPIPYLTPPLREKLASIHPLDMVRKLGGKRWLRLQQLGRGGQGEVWLACPCSPAATRDELVALKSPNPIKDNSKQQLQLEIQILGKIDSPYVVALVAEDWALGVLATRFVNGANLEETLDRQRRLSVAETVQIGINVCHALQALHAENFIHKDVKPGNIVQQRSKHAVLIDFGLAEDPQRAPLRPGGTPYYIAPEVFFSDAAPAVAPDARADVYSLAATLYHLLAGRPPHFQQCLNPRQFRASGARLDLLRFKLADAEIECNLEDVRRDVPRQLCQLLCRALNARPDERPKSAAEFRLALEAIQAKLKEAERIEAELWRLAEVLLQAVRTVNADADYAGNEQANAASIQNDLERALQWFPALKELRTTGDSWAGFPVAYAVVPRTMKIWTQVAGHASQIREFLAVPHNSSRHMGILLKDLVVRTLEGVRSISVEALAAAHDWRTLLLQLGLTPTR